MELGLLIERFPFLLSQPVLLFFVQARPFQALKFLSRGLFILGLAFGRSLATFGAFSISLGFLFFTELTMLNLAVFDADAAHLDLIGVQTLVWIILFQIKYNKYTVTVDGEISFS